MNPIQSLSKSLHSEQIRFRPVEYVTMAIFFFYYNKEKRRNTNSFKLRSQNPLSIKKKKIIKCCEPNQLKLR